MTGIPWDATQKLREKEVFFYFYAGKHERLVRCEVRKTNRDVPSFITSFITIRAKIETWLFQETVF